MIYLAGAIAASMVMTFLMRYSENHQGNRYALNIWNYLAGFVFSWALLTDRTALLPKEGAGITLLAGAVNGILFVFALVTTQRNIKANGAPLSTTFGRLGVLIPAILSAIFFLEIPGMIQIAGLGLAIAAICLMNLARREERPRWMAGLMLAFLLSGTVDFYGKIYARYMSDENQTYFVLYTFLAAFFFSIFLYVREGKKEGKSMGELAQMKTQDILTGIGVGIPNQLTTLLVLWAARRLPAYVVYPTYSAGCIIMVNILNFCFFKEILTRRQYLATGMIGVALILLNL